MAISLDSEGRAETARRRDAGARRRAHPLAPRAASCRGSGRAELRARGRRRRCAAPLRPAHAARSRQVLEPAQHDHRAARGGGARAARCTRSSRARSGSTVMAWIFIVAAVSDLVDGWLARRGQQVTHIGVLLDPLADKLARLDRADRAARDGPDPDLGDLDGGDDRGPRARGDRAARDRVGGRPDRRGVGARQAQDRRAEHRGGRAAVPLPDARARRARRRARASCSSRPPSRSLQDIAISPITSAGSRARAAEGEGHGSAAGARRADRRARRADRRDRPRLRRPAARARVRQARVPRDRLRRQQRQDRGARARASPTSRTCPSADVADAVRNGQLHRHRQLRRALALRRDQRLRSHAAHAQQGPRRLAHGVRDGGDPQAPAQRTARRARQHDLSRAPRTSCSCRCSRARACASGTTSRSRSRPSGSTPPTASSRCARCRRWSAARRRCAASSRCELFETIFDRVVPVSSTQSAEMVKLLENTFRAINIGLVNEVAMMCDRLGLDVWEVIEAAATKPYGYMKFLPGPGPRRPLHPGRPHLSLVEDEVAELPGALHRARHRDQRPDARARRRPRRRSAQRRPHRGERLADPDPRRGVQGERLRRARVARARRDEAAAREGRRDLLPRSRTSPSSSSTARCSRARTSPTSWSRARTWS